MGAAQPGRQYSDFAVEQYRRQGLSDDDIYQLLGIFQDLGPNSEGFVQSNRIKQQYQESMNKKDFDLQIGNMEQINWDTFYNIMSNDIIEKKERFGDVQFDSSASDVGCVFCPYTVDKRQDR